METIHDARYHEDLGGDGKSHVVVLTDEPGFRTFKIELSESDRKRLTVQNLTSAQVKAVNRR